MLGKTQLVHEVDVIWINFKKWNTTIIQSAEKSPSPDEPYPNLAELKNETEQNEIKYHLPQNDTV